jgi:hypothetical protein
MSTAKLILLLILAGALTIICPMAFANAPKEAANVVTFEESFLDLSGVMTINGEKVANYTVCIFQDGSPSDTFQVTNRLEQHYMLPLNHNYALKFTRPGCKDRLMLVNTIVDAKRIHDVYTFRYDIQFIEHGESNTFDDFPVAVIHYDQQQKDFDYNREYHSNVRTDIPEPVEGPSNTNTAGSNNQNKSWH